MMDVLVDKRIDFSILQHLLSQLFNIDKEYIAISRENDEVDFPDDIQCWCLVFDTSGDAQMMLQLYRIESINQSLLLKRLSYLSTEFNISFFIPCDNFDKFYKISPTKVQTVRLDEDKIDKQRYCFSLIE
ncbi:hypothetical protein [Moraxella cuniculi]|uniref:Uncharacterized protein n=1 Tax=Moraxella cuniculi TaxID=34061 RepID=A0A448GTU1_9GAMM|nr:hypothetical protein [Moraxella cuniculi]VEG12230.1 Uncharacterised protein [Moraxella cuniculi]